VSVAYTSRRPRSITAALFTEWRTKLALAIVPVDLRASVAGDLFEQLETRVVPERGVDRARTWLYAEIVRSAPAMIRHRLFGGPADLLRRRWWSAGLVLVLHAIVLCGRDYERATPLPMIVVAAGLLVPWSALLLGATAKTMTFTASGIMLSLFIFDLLGTPVGIQWWVVSNLLHIAGTPEGLFAWRRAGPRRMAR
jgi:hypothetical protein